MSLAPGTRLGRYEVRSKLGAGGMAEVYLADDTELGRRVAIKVLPDDSSADAHASRRLLREARSAATLEHPNICAIYDVGESSDRRFIAMQFVDGLTLDARVRQGPIETKEVIALAIDITDALAHAHAHHIVHRDIKPSNVIVTPRGRAMVMDFGLAKSVHEDDSPIADAATQSMLSAPGVVMGTIPYMSPEQVRGEVLDARTDIFSLGVMLHEMLSGKRPFGDSSPAGTAAAILTREPPPLADTRPDVPPELERIVAKMLRKDPDQRYQTAKDLFVDLRALLPAATGTLSQPVAASPGASRKSLLRSPAALIVAALVIVAGGAYWYWDRAQTTAALADLDRIEVLVDAGNYRDAYPLAQAAERRLPGNSRLAAAIATGTILVNVKTDPANARVFLKAFAPDASGALPPRVEVGTTPLAGYRVPRGEYVLSIEREGYAPVERTISGTFLRTGTLRIPPPKVDIVQRLVPLERMPAKMVAVPGGDYRLVGWSRPTDNSFRLDDFYIDKYEVSNDDYKAFIDAGGYLKRDFWHHAFVKDGRQIPWDEAMKAFVDRTGLPGPRSWTDKRVPEGKGAHPVTDITWYEAAAYAAFRGKVLPTAFQWEKAARNGMKMGPVNFMPWGAFYPGDTLQHHANFEAGGTVAVTAHEFGMSPFGAYNMAGNVAEWTSSDTSLGHIATGGAWGEPTYVFAQYLLLPGFYSSSKVGFRCAINAPDAKGDQGSERIEIMQEIPTFTPSSAADFAKWRAKYDYDAAAPLDAKIEEIVETAEWRRERITFNGAGGKRAIAYLYLPLHFQRPLQVIHYVPGGDVANGLRSLPASMEDRLDTFIKSGRAALGVVLSGYIERLLPPDSVAADPGTVEYLERVVARSIDLRRGLDYLKTRQEEIDNSRIAFFGPSAGSQLGLILAAVEERYRSVVLAGAGVNRAYSTVIPAANPANFASHIRPPKLMLHGLYDEDTPIKTQGEPLYALLPNPKKMVTYEGGHIADVKFQFTTITAWLDETMGPVKK